MKKKIVSKQIKRCDNCIEKRVFENKEYCSLRGDRPTEYSMQLIGKEHDCPSCKEK